MVQQRMVPPLGQQMIDSEEDAALIDHFGAGLAW
jgi:hypothetical protein